jgi:UDP-N-acetylglucosamine--N-acetylmuramyl-(pentapeptide) pyrophosphoryl-undecaprenol N-acetylglucosamine transferase
VKILIIAGGTGGHIFPALAVANQLKAQGHDILWLGAPYGLEKKLITGKFPIELISVTGLRKNGILKLITAPFQLMKTFWQSSRIIGRYQPDAVLAMGGYVCGPSGLAAWARRVPLIVHEQNSRAGFTNRILRKFATQTLAAFPNAFSNSLATVVGNPVREDILAIEPPEARLKNREKPLRLLILGGSQGAQAINEVICAAAKLMAPNSVAIIHQAGEKHFLAVNTLYSGVSQELTVKPFIEDMRAAYAWADFVIARAGALTVAELTAAGIGSLLIPYPNAVDDHQWHNAQFLRENEAAFVYRQAEITPPHLAAKLNDLIEQPEMRLHMAISAKKLAKPNAVSDIIDVIIKSCGK